MIARDRKRLGVVLLALLGVAPPITAAERLAATPKEIEAAAKASQPGDTILLRDGSWRDADVVFEANGAADRPITLRAQTPGQVILSGRSRLRIAGSHLVVAGLRFEGASSPGDLIAFRRDSKTFANHCRLTDCAVIRCDGPDRDASTRWVSLYGRENRVDHCRIEGKTGLGTTLVVWLVSGQPAGHRIDHNHFSRRPPLGQNGGETIRVGDSTTSMTAARVVVESNYFEECDGEAEIISNKSCENIYRNNTFVRCSGALTLRHGNDCTVDGNVFLGEKARGTGGVRVIGEGHRVVNNHFAQLEGTDGRAALSIMSGIPNSPLSGYFPVRNAVIAHNTFVDCRETLVVGFGSGSKTTVVPEDCEITDNLLIGDRAPLIDLRVKPVRFAWRDNVASGAAAVPNALPDGVRAVPNAARPDPNPPLRAEDVGTSWKEKPRG